jgi:virginiamycin B lyase
MAIALTAVLAAAPPAALAGSAPAATSAHPVLTLYPGNGLGSFGGTTTGPDGAMWFGSRTGIGRITTSEKVTVFHHPGIGRAMSITTGPDGALWFGNGADSTIGRITTSGQVTIYPVSALQNIGIQSPRRQHSRRHNHRPRQNPMVH